MASDRPNQTLADYVAIAISPALIMGLVGSLVFFLLEVFYPEKGDYKDRLQWILFFFVFGAVLVGRISLTAGIAGRAGLYGLVLAGLTWVGMQIYVTYPEGATAAFAPLINLFLVGVVWWCAHRLTHDCTDVSEETEVNGEGLLQATGLEKPADAAASQPAEEAEAAKKDERSPSFLIGWWERYQRFHEAKKKRRVLGGWVIYFSLAALPLFGLGEALIPAEETDRRQFAFWLMCVYVGCGLGLLLTTCFLGLRRYLRQRRLQMPTAMTAAWLTAGGGLIAALLVVGALLPRPRPEYSLSPGMAANSGQLSASNYATQGGSSGKDQGRQIGQQAKDKADQTAGDKNTEATGRDKGESAQDKDKGDSAGGKDKDGSGKGSDKDKDKDGSGKDKDKDSSQKDKGDSSSRPQRNNNPDPAKEKSSQPQQQPQKDSPPRDKTAAQQNQGKQDQSSSSSPGTSPRGSSWDWTAVFEGVAAVLKWVVFALLILAVICFLMREGLKFLAQFTDWAKNLLKFLQSFWAGFRRGGAKTAGGEDCEGAEAERGPPPRPFSSYRNPFLDGEADGQPIKEVVCYTFDALQAWAREHGVERRPVETPLEFAARLGEEYPAMEADVRRFVALYARAVYDYSPLPGAAAEQVRRFWERLEAAAEQPMSA